MGNFWENIVNYKEKSFAKDYKTMIENQKTAENVYKALTTAKKIIPSTRETITPNRDQWLRAAIRHAKKTIPQQKNTTRFAHIVTGRQPWYGAPSLGTAGMGYGDNIAGRGLYAADGWLPYYNQYTTPLSKKIQAKIIDLPNESLANFPLTDKDYGSRTGLTPFETENIIHRKYPEYKNKALLHNEWAMKNRNNYNADDIPDWVNQKQVVIRNVDDIKPGVNMWNVEIPERDYIYLDKDLRPISKKTMETLGQKLAQAKATYKPPLHPWLKTAGTIGRTLLPTVADIPLSIGALALENELSKRQEQTDEMKAAVKEAEKYGIRDKEDWAKRKVESQGGTATTSESERFFKALNDMNNKLRTNPMTGMYVAPQSSTYVQPLPFAR